MKQPIMNATIASAIKKYLQYNYTDGYDRFNYTNAYIGKTYRFVPVNIGTDVYEFCVCPIKSYETVVAFIDLQTDTVYECGKYSKTTSKQLSQISGRHTHRKLIEGIGWF